MCINYLYKMFLFKKWGLSNVKRTQHPAYQTWLAESEHLHLVHGFPCLPWLIAKGYILKFVLWSAQTHRHIYTYTLIHIYTYTHIHLYTYTLIHIYTYVHIIIYLYIYILYIYILIYLYMYIRIYIYIYVCMYIYIYLLTNHNTHETIHMAHGWHLWI